MINERGQKKLRDQTWTKGRPRDSLSGSSESPASQRSKRYHGARHTKARSVKSVLSCSTDSMSESSNHESENDSDESNDDDDSGSLDSGYHTGVQIPRASRFFPTFTGEGEKWKVWFARFEDVAETYW